MLLSEYLSTLENAIHEYAKTNLIIDFDIGTDFRTEKIGIIRGRLSFVDESRLLFTEYVDARYRVEKIAYSYHYQDRNGNLMFRYDNARHKPQLTFQDHKHISNNKTIQSDSPDFSDILEEIVEYLV